MNTSELTDLLAEGLEVEPSALTPETRIADVDEWNSIAWLTIMSLADERLGIEISSKDIRGFSTVGDVLDYLGARAAAKR